ncbi:TPA: hypothetical protein DEP58_05560 [Patescibacteria group bacterium]|nr:MAG: hypothetical protein UU98_C0004G0010 [Parcubacteria group bacterium GW2011_GWD2_42_14]HCC05733.1 hypothetical protein [Patescibacteria group bacterium]
MPGSVPAEVQGLVGRIVIEIINPIIGVIFAAALVYFLWGLLMFVINAGNEAKRGEYKQHMLWGLIGLVVMISAYALIEVGLRTFGVENRDMPEGLPISL